MNVRRVCEDVAIATLLIALVATPAVYATSKGSSPSKGITTTESSVSREAPAIKDAWLDGKLEATFLFNDYLDSSDIATDVQNGVAHLSGAVDSDLDRGLAGEIAKSIKGIDRVDNKLVVDKAAADKSSDSDAARERERFRQTVQNATLTTRIKSKLLLNDNTSGLDIDVDAKNGLVTLTGDVASAQEGTLALEIARNTSGARSVTNNLRVAQ